ncbi:MAG: hypothetical protein HKN36_10875 [Hellea sp.]|nr:hypothetical protein [Hellea sp.]
MGKRVIAGLLLTAFAGSAYAAEPVCDSADHCVWIMENHGPHEFDYDILTQELLGFGAEGKEYLIMLTGDKDPKIAGRAIDILVKGRFPFSKAEVEDIIKTWPGSNVEKLAHLLVKIGTRDVQSMMISSLLSDDDKIRFVARDVLFRMRASGKIYPLKPFEYGPIARAVMEAPTRELIQMLAAYPDEQTVPILKRILESEDAPSLIAAYEALYERDPEMAFETLLATFSNLETDQSGTSFAIAELLRRRHPNRKDGFYLQFAKELAEDPEMSSMGRVAGLDAILGWPATGDKLPSLDDNEYTKSAFEIAIFAKQHNISPYEQNFIRAFPSAPEIWAKRIWEQLKHYRQSDPRTYDRFFRQIKSLDSQKSILIDAFAETENLPLLTHALQSAIQNPSEDYLPAIEPLTHHWSNELQILARLANRSISGQPDLSNPAIYKKTSREIRTAIRDKNKLCKVKGSKLTDYVAQLPYFTLEEEVSQSIIKRRYISSTYPTPAGWFVGFDGPTHQGGLWFFDNITGLGDPVNSLDHAGVIFIGPITLPDPGQYMRDFWVISRDSGSQYGRLSTARQTAEDITSEFQRFLPHADFEVSILPGNRYLLSHDTHSSLILEPDGSIKPACE